MEDDDEHKVIRILSFEGTKDGQSDFVAVCILKYWERELRKEFNRNVPLSECFDIIAGSGMGGITALSLTDEKNPHKKSAQSSAKNIVKLYKAIHTRRIPFEKVIGNRFLEKKIKNISSNVIITSYDYNSKGEFVFDKSKKFLIKDVALATSALPHIASEVLIEQKNGDRFKFRAADIHESNPTMKAIIKAQEKFPKAKNFLVVILGGQEEQATKDFLSATSHSYKQASGGVLTYIPIVFNVSAAKHNDIDALSGIGRRYETDAQVLQVLQLLKECVLENGFQLVSEIGTPHVQFLHIHVQSETGGELLNLSALDISNEDLPHIIKFLQKNTSLTEINLSDNKINAFAARSLKYLLQNSKIKRLILDKNDFGSTGTQPLKTQLDGTSLCYLGLADNNLGDRDISPILDLAIALPNLTINLQGIQITQSKNLTILKKYAENKRIINPPTFLSKKSIYSTEQDEIDDLKQSSLSLQSNPSYQAWVFPPSKKRTNQTKHMKERGIIVEESLNAAGNFVLLRKQMKKKKIKLAEEKEYFDALASTTGSKTSLDAYTQAAILRFNQSYTDLNTPAALEQSLQVGEGYSETIFFLNPVRSEYVSGFVHSARTNEINNARKNGIPLHHRLHPTANLVRGEKTIQKTDKVIWDAFLVESHLRADRLKAEREELEDEIAKLKNKTSGIKAEIQRELK